MSANERVFYTSENGDQWLLIAQDDAVVVRHQPNLASGGEGRTIELEDFLSSERHTPQNQALRKLVATLAYSAPLNTETQSVKIYDHNSTE